ncbi:unnamed protein product, partial [Polarella glacialis]
ADLAARFAGDGGGAEALLAAEGAEALKARLLALGLKAGGAPVERAKRLLQLQGITQLADLPKDLLAKGGPIAARPPVKFVRASGQVEAEAKQPEAASMDVAD